MYLQRPDDTAGRSRFLLALSLSTVTAFAVAAPLAFKAMAVDAGPGGADAEVSEIIEGTTTTTQPSGPQIGPKVRSPQAKLPIGPGLPSDYPIESTTDEEPAPASPPPAAPVTRPPVTPPSTTTTIAVTTSTTDTTAPSSSSSEPTTSSSSSTSSSTTSSTTSSSTSSSIATEPEPSSSLP